MQGDLTRRPSVGGLLAAVVGLALFIYFLQRAGVTDVVEGVRRLGMAFVVVVLLGGVRFVIRAAAWVRCLDTPHSLTLPQVFQAVVAGDALGNLTPLSIIVSEPAKGVFLRHQEPLRRTLPALAVENLFYTLSAMFIIGGGLIAVFLMLQTSGPLWVTTTAIVVAMVGFVATVHWIIWHHTPIGSTSLVWLQHHGIAPRWMERSARQVKRMEGHIFALYPRDTRRLVPLALLEFSFHALAIVEVYLVLSVVSGHPTTLLHAFVFESTNRFISFAFRFVPLRIGVDEAGSGMFADLLAFGTATGVTLAIVRKGRILVWIAVGVLLLVRHGLSIRQLLASRATEVAVVIMARAPFGGDPPKTRLARAVPDDETRRQLYAVFLEDTIRACRSLEGTSLRVAYTPDGGTDGFWALGIADKELLIQRGDTLGDREEGVFADLFAEGFTRIIMVGSDLPTLPVDYIRQAIDAVNSQTVVLGPTTDGGYYLMALAGHAEGGVATVPDLFSNVRWSTPEALADTCAAAQGEGLHVVVVPSWYDVDDEAGLTRLRTELADPSDHAKAPATAKTLEALGDAVTFHAGPPSPCAS